MKARMILPVFAAALYIFLYLPVIVLVAYSFNSGEFPAAWKGFSCVWYKELWYSQEIWRAFKNSMIIGVTASCMSVTMSLMFLYNARKLSYDIASFFYTNLIAPDIVLAIGLLSFFSYMTVPLGRISLIAGHTLLGLGFAIPILKARFDEMDPRMIEASYDLGARSWYTFWHVVMPFMRPAIFVAFLLVMIISLDDFLITFFCAGSSVQTLSLYIFTMIRSGISPIVNALSTLMLVVSSCAVLYIAWMNYASMKEQP